MRDQVQVFLTAVMFLTRLPCPPWVGHEPAYLARSTVYFPLIGLGVGLAGALTYALAAVVFPPFVAAACATAATIWLTGAFHEDALGDVFDGFGGGWTKEQILAIMKDSRLGTYGTVALVLALGTKVGALAHLPAAEVLPALVAAHTVGRWSSLPLIRWMPYAREDGGTGKPFAASVTPARLWIGTAATAGIVGVALGTEGLVVGAVAVAVTALSARFYHRWIGGVTGDCLGATNQLVELATYLVLLGQWSALGRLLP